MTTCHFCFGVDGSELCGLTLNLLTTTIIAPPSNASKWQMGFNSAFKGLKHIRISIYLLNKNQIRFSEIPKPTGIIQGGSDVYCVASI